MTPEPVILASARKHGIADEDSAAGYTWADIGALLGTTGQAASQRYGRRVKA